MFYRKLTTLIPAYITRGTIRVTLKRVAEDWKASDSHPTRALLFYTARGRNDGGGGRIPVTCESRVSRFHFRFIITRALSAH